MSKSKILFVSAALILIFSACSHKKSEYLSFSGFTQGTTYSVIFQDVNGVGQLKMKENIEKLLDDFDNSLSTYNPHSIISAINNNRDTLPDSLFLNVFKRSREIWELSDGAFDITAGPLVNAWGFGPDEKRNFQPSELDSLMQLVGMDKVHLVNGHIVKDNPAMYLDVNAIAQGYSVDILTDYLSGQGIHNYLVEVGGEVRTGGTKAHGEFWKVGIDKPVDNNNVPGRDLQAIVLLSNKSLATSGNYRKFYEENGVKYSHTIDPKTGYPVRHTLLSASVVANDCMTADAMATVCMVLGFEKASALIEKSGDLDAYLVYSDDKGNFNVWMSDGMLKYLDE